MSSCCSAFERAADRQFDRRRVEKEWKRYNEVGPDATTRMLAEGIAKSGALKGSLLDVGSGIGALSFALLERGMTSAVAVDASEAYIGAARQEAERRGRTDAIRFVHGDFVAAASELPDASVVTLDRVVCCYPSSEALLDAALRRAERCIALSYPRDVWYVRAGTGLENGMRWLRAKSVPDVRASPCADGADDPARRVRAFEPMRDEDLVRGRLHAARAVMCGRSLAPR